MPELASVFQRAALDRPVVDHTGLSGRYDFDLEWTPDESQFGGLGRKETPESTKPDLFTAIQQQLGLRLEATKGPIATLVIDRAERPRTTKYFAPIELLNRADSSSKIEKTQCHNGLERRRPFLRSLPVETSAAPVIPAAANQPDSAT